MSNQKKPKMSDNATVEEIAQDEAPSDGGLDGAEVEEIAPVESRSAEDIEDISDSINSKISNGLKLEQKQKELDEIDESEEAIFEDELTEDDIEHNRGSKGFLIASSILLLGASYFFIKKKNEKLASQKIDNEVDGLENNKNNIDDLGMFE